VDSAKVSSWSAAVVGVRASSQGRAISTATVGGSPANVSTRVAVSASAGGALSRNM